VRTAQRGFGGVKKRGGGELTTAPGAGVTRDRKTTPGRGQTRVSRRAGSVSKSLGRGGQKTVCMVGGTTEGRYPTANQKKGWGGGGKHAGFVLRKKLAMGLSALSEKFPLVQNADWSRAGPGGKKLLFAPHRFRAGPTTWGSRGGGAHLAGGGKPSGLLRGDRGAN